MATNKDKIRASAQKHLQKGQIDKAIREFEKLIADDPKDVRTLLKIGDLQTRSGKHKEATDTYAKVAEFYSDQGFFLKAVAVYKQILKIDPTLIDTNLKLAEQFQEAGNRLAIEGRQTEAKRALLNACNYSVADPNLNEDARVQLHGLIRQQAIVGLVGRRSRLRNQRGGRGPQSTPARGHKVPTRPSTCRPWFRR